jgi:hypothetical protein
MAFFSGLFADTCKRENDRFVMHDGTRSEAELKLMQLGHWDYNKESASITTPDMAPLLTEILKHANLEVLSQGLPVSKLPEALQLDLREARLPYDAFVLVKSYHQGLQATIESSVLKLSVKENNDGTSIVTGTVSTPTGERLFSLPQVTIETNQKPKAIPDATTIDPTKTGN